MIGVDCEGGPSGNMDLFMLGVHGEFQQRLDMFIAIERANPHAIEICGDVDIRSVTFAEQGALDVRWLEFPAVEMDAAMQMDAAVHIAIGNNAARQTEAKAFGQKVLVSVVHPRASVSAFSHVGAGCFVAAGAVVGPAATMGIGVIVNHGAVVDHDTEIGDFSHIAQHASVCGHAKLGQRVLVGSGAVVLSSVVLGDDVVLSPGSVANCDLLASGLYSGNPAVKIQ